MIINKVTSNKLHIDTTHVRAVAVQPTVAHVEVGSVSWARNVYKYDLYNNWSGL